MKPTPPANTGRDAEPLYRDGSGLQRLRVTEIFYSLQGESNTTGLPTVFIRLTGCPLRCGYCDTAYAFRGGEWMTVEEILDRVASFGALHVTVTGGEPLAQMNCLALMTRLCDAGYRVSLETSGALDISGVDRRVVRVVDLKTPGSGEQHRNRYGNLDLLKPGDQIKFVICSETDYAWARALIRERSLADRCEILVSPAQGVQDARELAEWVLRDHLPVRFQIQLHKYLWGDSRGR